MLDIIAQYEVDKTVKRESTDAWCVYVRDAGRTQIEEGTLTCIAFKPMNRDKCPTFLNKLKLL